MDIWCAHAKSNGILLGNSVVEKPIYLNSRTNSMAMEIRVPRKESLSNCRRYRSIFVRAMGKKSPGDSDSSSYNSSSANSGNTNNSKAEGDGLKGNNPSGNNKYGDTGSLKSQRKPLDWREFRSLLYIQEQAENADSVEDQHRTSSPGSKSLPLKWAHPISAPENGCLLISTGMLDGLRTFERSVVLLLDSGRRNPQEGPFGVVINRPLHKKMKHMNPTNVQLSTTFAECSLHFGGPLDASMFLLRNGEVAGHPDFQEVVPGLYFGSRNSLNEASRLVKKGKLRPQDFRFFVGYAGWEIDQLREEIESGYWYVAACSANLIFGGSQTDGLWEEILQLMGGHYSALSRKPKQDI